MEINEAALSEQITIYMSHKKFVTVIAGYLLSVSQSGLPGDRGSNEAHSRIVNQQLKVNTSVLLSLLYTDISGRNIEYWTKKNNVSREPFIVLIDSVTSFI